MPQASFPRPARCYPLGQTCVLQNGHVPARAQLVDIGSNGARLRFAQASAAQALRYSRPLVLDTGLTVCGTALRGLACRLAWKSETEAGVEFETRQDFCLPELQRALDTLQAA